MSLLSLDFTTLAGGLCFFDMSFYQVDFFIALGFAIDLIPGNLIETTNFPSVFSLIIPFCMCVLFAEFAQLDAIATDGSFRD